MGHLNLEIVSVGTEILLGDLVDTNSAYIARALADHGADVFQKHSVGDNAARLETLLRGAFERADGVVTTGGLGPTVDDVTRDAIAAALGLRLELHEPSLRAIEARFAALGRQAPIGENNRRQAMIPRGALVLENPNGTAPGFVALRTDGKFVAALPGVPREMKPMLDERLVPWLVRRFDLREGIYTRTLHTVGLAESEIDARIEPLFRNLENPKTAVLAHDFRVDVKIMAKASDRASAERAIAPVEAELRERIGRGIFGVDEETLEAAIVQTLVQRKLTVATAESITGGGIADALVRVPGASKTFVGGVVAYDDALKRSLLGVEERLMREHGAVSEEVARAMASGARTRLGSDIAIATTGIAGPTGATPEKPIGLVWFAVANERGAVDTRRVTFPGSRQDVRRGAVVSALNIIWRAITSADSGLEAEAAASAPKSPSA